MSRRQDGFEAQVPHADKPRHTRGLFQRRKRAWIMVEAASEWQQSHCEDRQHGD
jgi:hypothetical protein